MILLGKITSIANSYFQTNYLQLRVTMREPNKALDVILRTYIQDVDENYLEQRLNA